MIKKRKVTKLLAMIMVLALLMTSAMPIVAFAGPVGTPSVITEGSIVDIPQQSGEMVFSFTPTATAPYKVTVLGLAGLNASVSVQNAAWISNYHYATEIMTHAVLESGKTYNIVVTNSSVDTKLSINKLDTSTMSMTTAQTKNFIGNTVNIEDNMVYFVAPRTGFYNVSATGYYELNAFLTSGDVRRSDNLFLQQGQQCIFTFLNVTAEGAITAVGAGTPGSVSINHTVPLQYDASGKINIQAGANDMQMGGSTKVTSFTPTVSGAYTFSSNIIPTSLIDPTGESYGSSIYNDIYDSSFNKIASASTIGFSSRDVDGNLIPIENISPLQFSYGTDLVAGQTYYLVTDITNLAHNIDITYQITPGATVNLPTATKYVPYGVKIESTASSAYTVVEGSLPAGMYLSDAGELYGVPQEYGTFSFRAVPKHSSPVTSNAYKYYNLVVVENTNQNVWNETNNDYKIEQYIGVPNANGDYVVQLGTQYELKSEGEFNEFVGLWLNGRKLVENVDYTKAPGSTIVTVFAQTFQNYATVGAINTIAMEFRTGGVPTGELKITAQNFIVEGSLAPTPQNPSAISPLTGADNDDIFSAFNKFMRFIFGE